MALRTMWNTAAAGIRVVGVLLTVGLASCEEQPAMGRLDPPHTPATGTSSSGEAKSGQPPRAELTRRCLEILAQISPVGQRLTPEDERLAGLVERPGQTLTQTAPLGRPHVSVDARGIILKKRCY